MAEKEVVDQIRKGYMKGKRNLVKWQMSTGVGCAYRSDGYRKWWISTSPSWSQCVLTWPLRRCRVRLEFLSGHVWGSLECRLSSTSEDRTIWRTGAIPSLCSRAHSDVRWAGLPVFSGRLSLPVPFLLRWWRQAGWNILSLHQELAVRSVASSGFHVVGKQSECGNCGKTALRDRTPSHQRMRLVVEYPKNLAHGCPAELRHPSWQTLEGFPPTVAEGVAPRKRLSRLLRTIRPAGLLSRCAAVTGSPHGGMTWHGQCQRELRSDTWKVLNAVASHTEEQLHLWKHLCGGQIRSFWWAGRTAKMTCPSPGLPEHSVVVLVADLEWHFPLLSCSPTDVSCWWPLW